MRNVQSDLRLRDMGLNHQNNLLRINKPIDKPNVLGAYGRRAVWYAMGR